MRNTQEKWKSAFSRSAVSKHRLRDAVTLSQNALGIHNDTVINGFSSEAI